MKLRIKEVVKAKGLNVSSLAKRMDITRQSLSTHVNGNPSMTIIQKIADALDCSVFELIEADKDFVHFYDQDGNYNGILRPKL